MRYFVRIFILPLLLTAGVFVDSASAQDTLPTITVTTAQLNFGNTPIGTSRQKSFLIINSSDTALILTGSVSSVSAPFTIDSGGGNFSIDSGGLKRVYISFLPQSLGAVQDSIVITNNSDSASNRIVVYISGSGFIPDTTVQFTISSTFLDFGTVYTGQSQPATFTIKNTSNVSLKLTGNVVDAHIPFHVTIGLGNFQLDSGQSKTVTIQMAPNVVGIYDDSVVVTTNADSPGNRLVIRLHATVVSSDVLKPQISVSADTINFGQSTPNPTQTLQLYFTVKNVSPPEQLLTVNILTPKPTSLFSMIGPEHLELNKSESQQFKVNFNPKAPGDYFDSIIIISDAPKSRIPVYLKAKVVPTGAVTASGESNLSSIEVYPNPARDIVMLKFRSDKQFKPGCTIYDASGRTVSVSTLSEVTIGENAILFDISQLPSGLYQGKIEGIAGTFRLIISK